MDAEDKQNTTYGGHFLGINPLKDNEEAGMTLLAK
jgi:hypothetical protein